MKATETHGKMSASCDNGIDLNNKVGLSLVSVIEGKSAIARDWRFRGLQRVVGHKLNISRIGSRICMIAHPAWQALQLIQG